MGGRKAVAVAESGRLGRKAVANAEAVEIRRQFAPSASHLHPSAHTGGASEAQQSPAELLRILAKESNFSLEGLCASCLSSNKVGSAHSITHQCSNGERVLLASALLR